jgi:imidazolonepropionase
MKQTILVKGARQLLTLRGPSGPRRGDALRDLGVIEDGSLLIVNGVIESVGPTRRIENLIQARSAVEITATGQVVLPGFVDSHTHLLAAPARGTDFRIEGERMLGSKLLAGLDMQYMRTTPVGTVEFNARRHLIAALRHGTTTLEAKTGSALNTPGEVKSLKVLNSASAGRLSVVPTFFGARFVAPEFEGNSEQYIKWLNSHEIPRIASRRMVEFVDVLCDETGFSLEQARAHLNAARTLGLGLKLHAGRGSRKGVVDLAVEMGATSVDGLDEIDGHEVGTLARSRTVATLMPANLRPGTSERTAPARDLLDSGAAVALASGFHPTAHSTFNMQMVVSAACLNLGMSPEEAISAATINGAHALARGERCGSLEYGKDADLLILSVPDYREMPYHFGANCVSAVMRKGKIVYREGSIACDEP